MSSDARPGRVVGVEEYRRLIGARHREEPAVGVEGSARAELVFNLTRLYTRLSGDFEAVHRRQGLTWAGFRILNVLWAVGPVELRDLARLSGASRASISSALNTLERDELVRRERDTADRRLVSIVLTGQGIERLREGMRAQTRREREWLAVLSPDDRARLTALLGVLADQDDPT